MKKEGKNLSQEVRDVLSKGKGKVHRSMRYDDIKLSAVEYNLQCKIGMIKFVN